MTNHALVDPAVRSKAGATLLAGHSLNRVYLVSDDDHNWFIRKVSREPAGNVRLRHQVEKQASFGQKVGTILPTPAIEGEGEVDGRYYFDMEFVRGQDAVSFLRHATYDEVRRFTEVLCNYIRAAAIQDALIRTTDFANLFEAAYRKLCDVQQRTKRLPDSCLSRIFLGLNCLVRHPAAMPTLCHGDLTLENLIIDGHGKVWTIDLLDAPFETYWHDVAKLHQDLDAGWYHLRHPRISQAVLHYISRHLLHTATSIDPDYEKAHIVMLAVSMARILPYANADEQEFLLDRIVTLSDRIYL